MKTLCVLMTGLCLLLSCAAVAEEAKADQAQETKEDDHKPLKIGNLALPSTQQPGPLISFGENIIDKGNVQVLLMATDALGRHKYAVEAIPGILYGLTQELSVFFNVPIAVRLRDGCQHSSGWEDLFLQGEYIFFNNEQIDHTDQATFVANISFPTGSATKNPQTGFGAPGFFLGATYNHTGFDWFYFTSYGAQLTCARHSTKIGNTYLYQFGIGRNLFNLPGWIFAWMVEADGIYSEKNKIRGVRDPNSGGNVIYVTPSLWISSEHLVVQLGAGWAVQQNLFGQQHRNSALLALNVGWTF